MKRRKYLKVSAYMMLIMASTKINALELGRFEQNLLGGLQGSIGIKLERVNQKLDVQIRGINEYDLVAAPEGAKILVRSGKRVDETFTVIVKYGDKEARREYSVSDNSTQKNSYIVKKGESLSNATRGISREAGGTYYQRAVALIETNPNAFSNGINTLNAGAILKVPTAKEVSASSPMQAKKKYMAMVSSTKVASESSKIINKTEVK